MDESQLTFWDWVCSCLMWFGEELDGRETRSTTLRNVGLVVGGGIAIWVAYWRSVISQRGLLNERYQKGTEMLGSEVLSVRLGGIYALQRLAEDDPVQYHVQIMRLLCAFVRNSAEDKDRDDRARPAVNEERGQRNITAQVKALMAPEDVQAALEAIGTRSDADVKLEKKEKFEPDLTGAQLRGVDLSKRKANLSGVDLSDAVFAPPNLNALNLDTHEFLFETPCIHAILSGTDLRGAKLFEVDLTGADLTGADLRGAKDLTQDQLDQACANPDNPPKLDSTLKPPCNKVYSSVVDQLADEG